MGYKIVAVNPLKPFPLPAFGISGLANIASLADATGQIRGQFLKAAGLRIESANVFDVMMWGTCSAADNCVERRNEIKFHAEYKKAGEDEVARLKTRWADGKIQPALDLHLTRQKRRRAHFDTTCRLEGCDNTRRQKRGSGGERGTKANRPGAKPLFCGVHVGLRKCLKKEALAELNASSAKRVRLI